MKDIIKVALGMTLFYFIMVPFTYWIIRVIEMGFINPLLGYVL